MDLLFAHGPDRSTVFGEPFPAPGVRVTFVPELLFAARERRMGRPVPHTLAGDEGLVVHEDPQEVLTWPCRLWRVADVTGVIRLQRQNRWFRCSAFTVVAELPAWRVLGVHGEVVAAVLEQAGRLGAEQVSSLSALDDVDERRLFEAGWSRWLATGQRRAPLGRGLQLVYAAVQAAARRTDSGLFAWDEADEVEVLADRAWRRAARAAEAAAWAFGAPELFSPAEREILARRWTIVMGPPAIDSAPE